MFKKLKIAFVSCLFLFGVNAAVKAEEVVFVEDSIPEETEIEYENQNNDFVENTDDDVADKISVDALENYDMSGSLFERITLLEQDKVVLQLEKERAQLDLELERLNAEKMKLQMELDTLSGRAEHQQQELEVAKAQLEAQAESIKRKKEDLENTQNNEIVEQKVVSKKTEPGFVSGKYKVINIVGIGNQLQATVEEVSSGQNKKLSVGKELDGYVVKSISLNDGIVFERDGVTENLNIGK